MTSVDQLKENYRQSRLAQRQALEQKVTALMQLQQAREQGEEEVSIATMRYSFATYFWETRFRQESRALRQYNEALRDELDRERRTNERSAGHWQCWVPS